MRIYKNLLLFFLAFIPACISSLRNDPESTANNAHDKSLDAPFPSAIFERPPYIAFFKVNSSSDAFTIIGLHSKPDKAIEEASWLDEVYEYISETYKSENVAIMGDLNLDCKYASQKKISDLGIKKDKNFDWKIKDDADTSVAKSKCAYDRIITRGKLFSDAKGKVHSDKIKKSDHLPISMKVKDLTLGAYNLQVFGKKKSSDEGAKNEIAGIACDFDVLLLQEIVSSELEPINTLLEAIKSQCGSQYEISLSEERGSTSYKERYAYLYNSNSVTLNQAFLFEENLTATIGACGINPYLTPKKYCYATNQDGFKVRVKYSCCQE
ncbi:MAG: hypothetical protein R3B45_18090 [Bdellovibrionota bacterium]